MFDLNALRADLAGKVAATGLPVTLDVRNVTPPCVVVELPRIVGLVGPCAAAVEIIVAAVAPPPGNADALVWLLDAVPRVLDAVNGSTAEPTTRAVAQGQRLPAYTVTVSTTVKE